MNTQLRGWGLRDQVSVFFKKMKPEGAFIGFQSPSLLAALLQLSKVLRAQKGYYILTWTESDWNRSVWMPIHHQPFLGSWLALSSLSFISLASSSGSLAAATAAAKVRRAFEGRIQAKKHVQGLNSWLVDGDVAYSADQVHVGLDVPCMYATVNRLDSKAFATLQLLYIWFLPACTAIMYSEDTCKNCKTERKCILTLFLPDLVIWRSYKGWFCPWPVGRGLRKSYLMPNYFALEDSASKTQHLKVF